MPKVIKHEQPMQMRHHGFSSPNPLKTAAWGSPNACSICHTDKDKYPLEKLATVMKAWGIVLQDPGTRPGI